MPTKPLQITNRNGQQLRADLELPKGPPHRWAVIANCFTCTRQIKITSLIARQLAETGTACLRFDYRGLGQSQGDFSDSDFATQIQDLHAAIQHLKQHYQAPQLLIGHSIGAAAAIQIANDIPSLQALVTIAAPAQPAQLLDHFPEAIAPLQQGQDSHIQVGPQSYRVKPRFLHSLKAHDGIEKARQLRLPWLILHAPDDDTVPYQHALTLQAQAPKNAALIPLQGQDHLISAPQSARNIAKLIHHWQRLQVHTPS